MEKIIYSSATKLAKAIRAGEVSSEQVVEAYLQRIEEVNPKLNAIIHLQANEARNQARKADAALAFECDNLVYGRTLNPYDSSRTSGGSSGGEAAIIAAGGSPLGLGNDMGGSILLLDI
jgi:Asp-tRNA(Asn)/Glu-tRNA(Gln) amidotransferase A subunit family amidase